MQENERFGLTRDELFATIFALLAGLLMMLGLFRCTPVWNALGLSKDTLDPTAIVADANLDGDATVTPAVTSTTDTSAADTSALRNEIKGNRDRIEELEGELAAARAGSTKAPADNNAQADLTASNNQITALQTENANLVESGNTERMRLMEEKNAAIAAAKAAEDRAAKIKADADAKAKEDAAALAKAKEDADAKAAKMAAKAKADAKAEADAKAKAMADEKARADADAAAAARKARAEAARQRRQSGQLFGSEEDLAPKALALGKDLRVVHGGGEAPLATGPVGDVYATVSGNRDARLVQRVAFGSGESGIGGEAAKVLTEAASKADPKAWFLVVGYADKTGEAAANKTLSEKRALSVANAIETIEGAGDRLQAFYIGETDRFSKTDNAQNRVVEIWEVKAD